MNAPLRAPRRDEQAEARRLVDALYVQMDSLDRMLEEEAAGPVHTAVMRIRDDLRDAAALLDGYQAGVALATPHPVTRCHLIERHAVDELRPPVDEIVLIWVADNLDHGRPWLGHIDERGDWWYVDSCRAMNVTAWALRPTVQAGRAQA